MTTTPHRLAKTVPHPVQPATSRRRAVVVPRDVGCCVIYLRVSTDEQLSSGAGIDAQLAECRAYADRQGWTVRDVVTEGAVSGRVSPYKRPGFTRALQILTECNGATLLVRRTDRVSRRVRDFLAVVDDADVAGWSIVTIDGKVDTATAAGRLQLNVMASVAQYERDVIAERTTEALAARAEAGIRLGRPSVLSTELLVRIAEERTRSRSLRAIAAGLNADKIPNPTGSVAGWTPPTVARALATHATNLAAGARRDADPLRYEAILAATAARKAKRASVARE